MWRREPQLSPNMAPQLALEATLPWPSWLVRVFTLILEQPLIAVGIPCAVAVQQVLNGTISEKGILAPMTSKINDPLKKELKEKYG